MSHLPAMLVAAPLLVAGALVAAEAIYLLALALAAPFAPTTKALDADEDAAIVVIVPAHDEADLIERCLASLGTQTYPSGSYSVVVIADNCSDRTAELAASAGARVLVRDVPDAPGKGAALRWAMDRLLLEYGAPDAVVVVDADSVADPALVAGLVARWRSGADAVQGEYLVLEEEHTRREALRTGAFLLSHVARARGRAALGCSGMLVGNGMLFSRTLLERRPWSAFGRVEDLEFSVQLRLADERVEFAPGAIVRAPVATSGRAMEAQRARWEGGRLDVARDAIPKLAAAIAVGRVRVLDALMELAIPPLGLLIAIAFAGLTLSGFLAIVAQAPGWCVIPWAIAAVALPGFVIAGLRAARAPARVYRALLVAPLVVVGRIARLARRARGPDAKQWVRTERPSEAARRRPDVVGVPVDAVSMPDAIDRIMAPHSSGDCVHVCTVNLDFLVTAHRDPEVATILRTSDLNLADGAPVLWLARLCGGPLPGRVTGADLVPLIAASAAKSGKHLMLVGGEHGAMQAAAEHLQSSHPRLRVTWFEPPAAPLEDLTASRLTETIVRARPDILLVAFGHPKQERWIATERERLGSLVAIGVGGSLDFVSGRARRAPNWMRRAGLEWLWRAGGEPIRLGRRYLRDAVWLIGALIPAALSDRRRENARAGSLEPR